MQTDDNLFMSGLYIKYSDLSTSKFRSVVKMNTQVKPVDNTKMLTLVALLSNYDLFHVSVSDGREFNASEIVNENSGSLKFYRTFSSATYSDSYVTSIEAINNQEFICKTLFSTYRITALHNKPDQIIVREHKGWNDIFDLMDVSFFGDRFTDYDTISDEITLVIDPYLLGELSIIEKNKIKHIINIYLNGISSNMQMCRTIYFQVKTTVFFLEYMISKTEKNATEN